MAEWPGLPAGYDLPLVNSSTKRLPDPTMDAIEQALIPTIDAAITAALAAWQPPSEPINAWAHWGDSMTDPSSSGNWVGKFATATGVSHYEGGVGGETALQIRNRQLADESYRNRKFTFEIGRNGFKTTPAATIVGYLQDMLNHMTSIRRGLIFDVAPADNDTSTGFSDERNALNALIESTFPEFYAPVYSQLLTETAAVAAGITFTSQDYADIAAGIIPSSFRTDGLHLNGDGGTAVSYFVQLYAYERGLITEAPELPALYDYGRTDATHRYIGSRLSGPSGAIVNVWEDSIGSADLATPAGSTQVVRIGSGPGGSKAVEQPNVATTGSQVQRLHSTLDPDTKTVIVVGRTPTTDGTRVLYTGDKWRLARASNGQMGIAARSGSGGSGAANTNWVNTWEVVAVTIDPATGACMVKRRGQTEVTGTITFGSSIGVDQLFSQDTVARDSSVAEVLTFATVLTPAQCETVMQAMATHYGIV